MWNGKGLTTLNAIEEAKKKLKQFILRQFHTITQEKAHLNNEIMTKVANENLFYFYNLVKHFSSLGKLSNFITFSVGFQLFQKLSLLQVTNFADKTAC